MHITRVQLENIKSHISSDYYFGRGTTAITGENGAGKTTILEAVAWALFDVLDYKKDDFVRRGAKKGTVRVTFRSDLDQREYTVYRDTAGGYNVFDPGINTKLAEKKHDVSAVLRLHLGVEPGTDLEDLFRHAIGVPQGTFTAAFLDRPTARKTAFDRLLKVEEYREGAERLGDTAKLIETKIQTVRERIAHAEGQLAGYDQLAADHKQARESLATLTASITLLIQQIEVNSIAVSEWDQVLRRLDETRTSVTRLEVESDNAARRLLERQTERDHAAAALTRRDAAADQHQKHLTALDQLKQLEQGRTERDKLSRQSAESDKLVAIAAQEVKRIQQALAQAITASEAALALEPAIAEQAALEAEREQLRNQRAEAASAETALRQLDAERDKLREQFARLRSRIQTAETGAGADACLAELRTERRAAETELARLQNLETSRRHLTQQRTEAVREADRLRKAVAENEAVAVVGEKLSAQVAAATALQLRETELTEMLANLRAMKARDEAMQAEVKNGLCPILSQKCLNLNEGENLDDHFRLQFANYSDQLAQLAAEQKTVTSEVRSAREAEKQLTRWEAGQRQLTSDRALLAERDVSIASLDAELVAIPIDLAALIDGSQNRLIIIESEEKKTGPLSLLFAELRPLTLQLEETQAQGTRLKESREELATKAGRLAAASAALSTNESKLKDLADPRGRASALRAEGARQEQLLVERAAAAYTLVQHQTTRDELRGQLKQFSELDAELKHLTAVRDETLGPHREFLALEPLAATLPAREADLVNAQKDAERIEREAAAATTALANAQTAYDADRHAAGRVALNTSREQLAAERALAEVARSRATRLGAELERLELIRESLSDELRERDELIRLAEVTDLIRDTLKQAGPLVARSYLYNISIEANQLFREITGEAGRTLRWAEDYEVLLEEDGHERPFGNLSGGEQMAAALAVRLALLKQLSDIRIAFFDEPTTNLDAERRERLANQIAQVQHFDQLFIISHDDTFEESVDHVVTVRR
ncbi:MAG: SMC family ATPase [Pyrinomonadaceae bacterium]